MLINLLYCTVIEICEPAVLQLIPCMVVTRVFVNSNCPGPPSLFTIIPANDVTPEIE